MTMSDLSTGGSMRTATPWHLWAVGLLSLAWNGMGALDYTMTHSRNAAYLSAMTPEQMAWLDGFPIWASTAWATGVWFALAGSILLLARSRWAVGAFALALVGIAGTTLYEFGLSDMPASLDTTGAKLFCAAIWAVTLALLWYAARMRARGVLR
jgi:hypothetical protein